MMNEGVPPSLPLHLHLCVSTVSIIITLSIADYTFIFRLYARVHVYMLKPVSC